VASQFDPTAVLGQLTETYVRLPLIQKILFPLLILGSVTGIIYVSKWANQPDFVVLYSDMDAANSSAVLERLKDQKIKYQVRNGGDTIAVSPPEVVHELRLTLAGEGIPKAGSVGLEIFEATNLGTTSFQEKVKWTRAIQGELERSITSLEVIKSARVHISKPEKTVFARKGMEAKASVMVLFQPGGELTTRQIKGISHLVAGSVEGLEIENVAIIDAHGNLLTRPEDQSAEGFELEATRLQYQREIEKGYQERIEQMLSKILGQGKVVAKVSTEMDFSMYEKEEESFDPAGQVLRSEREVQEGTGLSQTGGVPGVVSNLSKDQNLLAPPGSESSGRSESVKNYEVSKAISRTSSPRGKLLRLSVAVLVDGKYEVGEALADGSEPAKTFHPLDTEVLDRIEGIVKSAVGYDPVRGDTVTVENIPFHLPETNYIDEMNSKAMWDMVFRGVYWAVPILFILLFFLMIVKPLVRFLTTPTEAEVDLERLLPTGIQELEKELETERARAQVPAYEPSVDLDQLEELMAENSRVVKENPQQAALLIRYWLNDGRL